MDKVPVHLNTFAAGATRPASNSLLRLKRELTAITALVPPGSRVALLDEPVHRNIGDHLIHLGIERFVQDHKMSIVARANTYNYHRGWFNRHIDGDTVILCCGGGHLGDLYPHHQQLREQAITDFPGHRVVILPQSVYFRNPAAERQASAIFRAHPDFHLFVRDRESLARADRMGVGNLYLVPDMAHALYPLDAVFSPACNKTLWLLRKDLEATSALPPEDGLDDVSDWPDIVTLGDTLALGAMAAIFRLFRAVGPSKPVESLLDRKRAELVNKGIEWLNGYDRIYSTRLHGALLGLLLGKRVRLLASMTGKSSAYYHTWLANNEDCEYSPAQY